MPVENKLSNKKVLLTCGGGVGDIIMFTPALKALKEQYNCHITFLTPRNADILKGLPYIDKIIFMKRGRFLGRYRNLLDLAKQDAIIFSDWQPQLLWQAHILRVSLIAGIKREGYRLSKYINKTITFNVFETDDYVARTHAHMIEEALDIKLKGDMTDIDVPQTTRDDSAIVDNLLADIGIDQKTGYIALSPFTGLEERNWGCDAASTFVKLAIEKYDMPVVVLGTKDVVEQARKISPYCLAGRTTLLQTVELIRRAKLLVTPDSGPMHIAGAVGTPVVALFNKDLPSRWAPKKNCEAVYLGYDCSPCDDETAINCKYNLRCMRDITAEMVMDKIERLFAKNKDIV